MKGKIKSAEISKKEVKVFPNPIKDRVNIQSEYQIESISISDISGRKLISTKQNEIDVSALKTAVYFLKITTKSGIFTQKVIIEK